jgi:imidazolonepropionase-like amidohydrolase
MTLIAFKNARLFDGLNADCAEGMQVLVEDGVIREVSDTAINASGAEEIDVGGRTLMPGLIDAHIHAYACDVNVQRMDLAGEPYRTSRVHE